MPLFDETVLADPRRLARIASEVYRMRRVRDGHMPKGLMGEPAWDMLLALFAEEPSTLTESSLCYGSGITQTSAMRWIAALVEKGLVERTQHARDPSLILLSLTAEGRRLVEQSLQAMLRAAEDSP